MPLSIAPESLLTVSELEAYFAENGDRAPKRTMKKLREAGLTPRGGKLILGADLLKALRQLGERECQQ